MTEKSRRDLLINLGDRRFNSRLSVYYSWIMPAFLSVVCCCLFIDRAYITGLAVLLLVLFILPVNKRYTSKLAWPLRILIMIGLVVVSFYSMYLYQ